MSRLATSAQMLTYLYYKNKSFSRKAVDVLFGSVWVGKGIKSKSNQIKWAHKYRNIHCCAMNISTEQLNNLMHNIAPPQKNNKQKKKKKEDVAQCI